MDHFSIFLIVLAFLIWIVSSFFPWNGYLIGAGWLLILMSYFRSFSKNKLKRHQENIRFLKWWYPIQSRLVNKSRKFKAKHAFKYFKCPSCRQKLRLPRKSKRAQVRCPKCGHTFLKESLAGKIQNVRKN